jgi:tetratricopeptide (TPR) repeat protein
VKTGHRAALALLLCAAGCTPVADHERLGDRRYAEHAFTDALAEYRLAMRQQAPDAELRAKFAAAALQAGSLGEAVTAYHELARAEPGAEEEAADGLTRTARLAIGARDMAALSDALVALRDVAPQRPVGFLAVALGAGTPYVRRPEGMDVLLEAAAAASSAVVADSFLVAYADLNAHMGRCDAATPTYQAVLRRDRQVPTLVEEARGGLAGCAVEDGKVSLSAGALQDAETSFRKAIAIGQPDSVVRLAWLLVGDARWARGDTAVAQDAYRRAMSGAPEGDPIAARANDQLTRLLGKGTPTP